MDYAVCFLFNEEKDQVLLQPNKGKWNGIIGKPEPIETEPQCILRQIKEFGMDIPVKLTWLGDQITPTSDFCYANTTVSFYAGIINKEKAVIPHGSTWFDLDGILTHGIDDPVVAKEGNVLYYLYQAKQYFAERKK